MTATTRRLILGFALLGLLFSGWAAYVHYRLLTQPNYVSPCDINATFNCSQLYLSRFGSVAGVSVALGGVIFFVLILLIAGPSASRSISSEDDAVPTYVFALSTIGLAAVLYLAWASYFVLKKFCPLCIGTYAAVIGLFLVSGMARSLPIGRLPGRLVADLRGLTQAPQRLLVAIVSLAIAALAIGWFPREAISAAEANAASGTSSPADQENFDKIWAAQPRTDLGIPADGARVVIVKFNDWQCPACKAGFYTYKPILEKYAASSPGAIKYVTKDYPLNSRCNFTMASPGHPAACEAAAAVRLATERGKGDEMAEWLFGRQETLTPQVVEAEVKQRFGIEDFASQYDRLLPAIKRDVADGAALHIQYTPTYYVNGVKAQTPEGGFILPQYFDWAIQYELAHAGSQPADSGTAR